jgi:hypothetical protein
MLVKITCMERNIIPQTNNNEKLNNRKKILKHEMFKTLLKSFLFPEKNILDLLKKIDLRDGDLICNNEKLWKIIIHNSVEDMFNRFFEQSYKLKDHYLVVQLIILFSLHLREENIYKSNFSYILQEKSFFEYNQANRQCMSLYRFAMQRSKYQYLFISGFLQKIVQYLENNHTNIHFLKNMNKDILTELDFYVKYSFIFEYLYSKKTFDKTSMNSVIYELLNGIIDHASCSDTNLENTYALLDNIYDLLKYDSSQNNDCVYRNIINYLIEITQCSTETMNDIEKFRNFMIGEITNKFPNLMYLIPLFKSNNNKDKTLIESIIIDSKNYNSEKQVYSDEVIKNLLETSYMFNKEKFDSLEYCFILGEDSNEFFVCLKANINMKSLSDTSFQLPKQITDESGNVLYKYEKYTPKKGYEENYFLCCDQFKNFKKIYEGVTYELGKNNNTILKTLTSADNNQEFPYYCKTKENLIKANKPYKEYSKLNNHNKNK